MWLALQSFTDMLNLVGVLGTSAEDYTASS